MQSHLAWATFLLPCAICWADESASEIARKSRERGALNLLDLTAVMKLTTVDKEGHPKEQVLTSSAKKIDGRARSIARFLRPPSVAGVAVLTVEGKGDEVAEISLYLPKLKRVRRIARTQRGQSFMDTDFNYADLGASGAEDRDVKRLADDRVDGRDAFVLTRSPGSDAPYGQVTAFVDKETYVPLKVEYRDREGKPFKRYRSIKLRKFKDRTLAAESVMENLQSGSKTTLELTQVEESHLGDDAFTERALERG